MIRRFTVLVAATLLALILAAPAALAGEPPRYRGSPFSTIGVTVTTLRVWAPTLPSS
jgi:ABC-type sugar transport system substrate-binding protein